MENSTDQGTSVNPTASARARAENPLFPQRKIASIPIALLRANLGIILGRRRFTVR